MQNFDRQLQAIYAKSLAEKRVWYSDVAAAYDRARPRYPERFIERGVDLAQLSDSSTLLEIGCGPGIATLAFARRGFSMTGLEPSQAACKIARARCQPWPNVEIVNSTFEEWDIVPDRFDAVIAATSWHWIGDADKYRKVWETLKASGTLILLWNTPPEPIAEVHQHLRDLYDRYAPQLADFSGIERHAGHLEALGEAVLQSGWFEAIAAEQMVISEELSRDRYLELLSTLSPYIALPEQTRAALLAGLGDRLERDWNARVPTQRLSALQVFQPREIGCEG